MRIHFIAIGGSIMHALAIAMHRKGHAISGSDDEIYEPSRSRLAREGLLPDRLGWDPDRIIPGIDQVVLGMHARKDNPELLKAQALGLPVVSFPEFMFDVSRDKTRIVIAGSHGKTTTSGMIAHAMEVSGVPADRMIGASIGTLEPVSLTGAPVIVLEGDEYLSSPLDPRAKFLHYDPDIAIITGIAWDHMNVFPTHEAYIAPFKDLITGMRPEATLIYCADDPALTALVETLSPACHCMAYHAVHYRIEEGKSVVFDSHQQRYPMQVFGHHNMQNMSAAQKACALTGLAEDQFLSAMQSFTGAHKRLQLLYEKDALIAYQDFAHAPSKVTATVSAVREKHPEARIIACLELHTYSSLNPAFLPQYRDALRQADVRIVYYSPHTLAVKKLPDLSPDQLAVYFGEPALQVVQSVHELAEVVGNQQVLPGLTVMLWMSSGRFDGLDLMTVMPGSGQPVAKGNTSGSDLE